MEKMNEFFAARADGYEEHMLTYVEGSREAYIQMAKLLPKSCKNLLDLGCGTGLELDEIFKLFPNLDVTGIDLTQDMLDKLLQKHRDVPRLLSSVSSSILKSLHRSLCRRIPSTALHRFLQENL